MSRRRNRKAIRAGAVARVSDCAAAGRRGKRSELLPAVSGVPSATAVDGAALAAEVARLAATARRGWNT